MLMTKEHLARVARNLKKAIEANDLLTDTAGKVGNAYGDEVDDSHAGEEYVSIDRHPARPAYLIDYFRRSGQTPIRLIVSGDSVKIALTCTDALPGYEVFDDDQDLGKMQDRRVPADQLMAELENLSKLA